MWYSEFNNSLKKTLSNLPGWRTNRKIVVIESDDWGSIRMPSKDTYNRCINSGYPIDKSAYERYDSLLSKEDLELLFELLLSFKDNNGNHPIITANCLVANPDFVRIKQNNYQDYHFELITETFKRYPKHEDNFRVWCQAINDNIFHPQFHAREHLNVSFFMDALQKGDEDAHFAFKNEMPGIIPKGTEFKGNYYVESTKYKTEKDKTEKLKILLNGLDIFEKLFGYKAVTITPPNYIWSPDFNRPVFEKGINIFQGVRMYFEPDTNNRFKNHSIRLGYINDLGQTYLVRNVLFEPTEFKSVIKDPVDRCLADMASAFRVNKPSIISSHRINFVGYIDEVNRDSNLYMLKQILKKSMNKWPEIEFLTSDQLGQMILEEKK